METLTTSATPRDVCPHLVMVQLRHGQFIFGGQDILKFNLVIFGNFVTRTWLRYVRVFAVAIPSVCRLSVCL